MKESGMRDRGSDYSRETRKRSLKTVIKESEMALFVTLPGDQKRYMGEAGNLSYGEQKGMFTYIKGEGAHVDGSRLYVDLREDDVIELYQNTGFVSVKDFFGDKDIEMSDYDFTKRAGELTQHVNHRKQLLFDLAKAGGLPDEGRTSSFYLNESAVADAWRAQKQFTPKELLDAELTILQEWLSRIPHDERTISDEDIEKLPEFVERINILSEDPKEVERAIVDYFEVWRTLKGITGDDYTHDVLVKVIKEDFPYATELIEEFEKNKDPRFSSALALACREVADEWAREEDPESAADILENSRYKGIDFTNLDTVDDVFVDGKEDELEAMRKFYVGMGYLSAEKFEQSKSARRLREQVLEDREKEYEERIANNPKPTQIEVEMGTYIEAIEPQVIDAVLMMREKGYETVSSGFSAFNTQGITCNNIDFEQMDESIKERLQDLGVRLEDDSFYFDTDGKDLDAMKDKWMQIAEILPDLGYTAKPNTTGLAESNRKKWREQGYID